MLNINFEIEGDLDPEDLERLKNLYGHDCSPSELVKEELRSEMDNIHNTLKKRIKEKYTEKKK